MVVPTDSEYVASRLDGSEFETTADAPVIDQVPRKAADSWMLVYFGSMLHGSVTPWGAGAGAGTLRVMRNEDIERKMRRSMVYNLLMSCNGRSLI